MKTANRAARKGGKKSPSTQSGKSTKNASAKTSEETVTMQFCNREGELLAPMELPKNMADDIKARAAIPALQTGPLAQGAHGVFSGHFEMAEYVHRAITEFAAHHSISDFDHAFRRALLCGLRVASQKNSACEALDTASDSVRELNFILEAVGGLLKTLSDNGIPTKKHLEEMHWGLSIFSARIRKSLEDSLETVRNALRDPEHSHASPNYPMPEQKVA